VSLAIWDHTVLPATRHKWAHPALTPAIQAGTRFTYPGGMEGWVDQLDLDLGDLLHTEMVCPLAGTVTHPSTNRAQWPVSINYVDRSQRANHPNSNSLSLKPYTLVPCGEYIKNILWQNFHVWNSHRSSCSMLHCASHNAVRSIGSFSATAGWAIIIIVIINRVWHVFGAIIFPSLNLYL